MGEVIIRSLKEMRPEWLFFGLDQKVAQIRFSSTISMVKCLRLVGTPEEFLTRSDINLTQ
jgi:hypothetical protein